MLIRTSAACNRPVNSKLVNWRPWSVLKIVGRVCARARSKAVRQNALSRELDSSQATTYRLYQSKIATRYTQPYRSRM